MKTPVSPQEVFTVNMLTNEAVAASDFQDDIAYEPRAEAEAHSVNDTVDVVMKPNRFHEHQEVFFEKALEEINCEPTIRHMISVELKTKKASGHTEADKIVDQIFAGDLKLTDYVTLETVELIEEETQKEAETLSSLFAAKASYELRRGDTVAASEHAKYITEPLDKISLFYEAGAAGELDVATSMGDLRAEIEATGNALFMAEYLQAEVKLGWNIHQNTDAFLVMINDPSLPRNEQYKMQSKLTKTLLAQDEIELAEQVWLQTGESKNDIEKNVHFLAACARRGDFMDYKSQRKIKADIKQFKRHRKYPSVYPLDESHLRSMIIQDAQYPDGKVRDLLEDGISSFRGYIHDDEADYLDGILVGDNYGLLKLKNSSSQEISATERIKLFIEVGKPGEAEKLYMRMVSDDAPKTELAKIAMELALHPGDVLSEDDNLASRCLADIDVMESQRSTESRTVMNDRIDQARHRQKYIKELNGILNNAKDITDPTHTYGIYAKAAEIMSDLDPESYGSQAAMRLFENAANACLNSEVAMIAMSADEIHAKMAEFGLKPEVA